MNVVIFGYGYEGVKLYRKIKNDNEYTVIGFADNSVYKQNKIVGDHPIMSMSDLARLNEDTDFAVIIAANKWFIIGQKLEEYDIPIKGIYQNGEIKRYKRMNFELLDLSEQIILYAGDICDEVHMSNPNLYGLSINKADAKHILHDITSEYPLPDNTIQLGKYFAANPYYAHYSKGHLYFRNFAGPPPFSYCHQ